MKTLNRKLAKKHFRYLNKKEIKDPLSYLQDYFGDVTNIHYWSRDVSALLQSGLDKRLTIEGYPYVSIGQELIKQVEIAYIIYTNRRLKLYSDDCNKIKTRLDRIEHYQKKRMYKPAEILHLFFKFQSIRKWREEIDWITHKAFANWTGYEYELEENSVVYYIYITELIYALHQIQEGGGKEVDSTKKNKPCKN